MAYGVATTNLFALLDDENEDPQVLAATKVAKVAPKKEEAPKEEAKKPAAPKPVSQGRGDGGRGRGEGREGGEGRGRGRGRGDFAGRGEGRGRGRGRGDYADRPPRSFQDGDKAAGDSAEGAGFGSAEGAGGDGGRGGRGGYRGRGRGRGRRGDGEVYTRSGETGGEGEGRSFGPRSEEFGERRPRRQYDRHDGTGRGHEGAKRGGAGKGNWGTDTDVAANAEATEPTAEDKVGEEVAADENAFGGGFGAGVAEEPAKAAAAAAEPAEGEAKEAEEKEEDEIQMTLDEYEKILAEKKAALNKQGGASEVDLSQFQGMAAYKRKDEDVDELGLELKNKKEAKQAKERARKEIVTLETGFKVQSAEELGGAGAAGRGRGRGRGRGGSAGAGRGPGPERPEGPPPSSGERSGERSEFRGEFRGGRGFRPPPTEERGGGAFAPRGRGRGRGTGPAPPIDDESAFPSLG